MGAALLKATLGEDDDEFKATTDFASQATSEMSKQYTNEKKASPFFKSVTDALGDLQKAAVQYYIPLTSEQVEFIKNQYDKLLGNTDKGILENFLNMKYCENEGRLGCDPFFATLLSPLVMVEGELFNLKRCTEHPDFLTCMSLLDLGTEEAEKFIVNSILKWFKEYCDQPQLPIDCRGWAESELFQEIVGIMVDGIFLVSNELLFKSVGKVTKVASSVRNLDTVFEGEKMSRNVSRRVFTGDEEFNKFVDDFEDFKTFAPLLEQFDFETRKRSLSQLVNLVERLDEFGKQYKPTSETFKKLANFKKQIEYHRKADTLNEWGSSRLMLSKHMEDLSNEFGTEANKGEQRFKKFIHRDQKATDAKVAKEQKATTATADELQRLTESRNNRNKSDVETRKQDLEDVQQKIKDSESQEIDAQNELNKLTNEKNEAESRLKVAQENQRNAEENLQNAKKKAANQDQLTREEQLEQNENLEKAKQEYENARNDELEAKRNVEKSKDREEKLKERLGKSKEELVKIQNERSNLLDYIRKFIKQAWEGDLWRHFFNFIFNSIFNRNPTPQEEKTGKILSLIGILLVCCVIFYFIFLRG